VPCRHLLSFSAPPYFRCHCEGVCARGNPPPHIWFTIIRHNLHNLLNNSFSPLFGLMNWLHYVKLLCIKIAVVCPFGLARQNKKRVPVSHWYSIPMSLGVRRFKGGKTNEKTFVEPVVGGHHDRWPAACDRNGGWR